MSVRALIIGGFGMLVVVLACVTAGAAYQSSRHQSQLERLEFHSTRASLIQNVETQASIAALLLQRYVEAGGDNYVDEINQHAAAAQLSLEQVLNMGGPPGFEEVTSTGLQLMQGASQAAELRRHGDLDLARQVLEDMVPVFRDYRLTLEGMTAAEINEVSRLRASADSAGQLAFWLLVASGAIGIFLGLVVSVLTARSIIRPLNSLEATAVAVSAGNLDARASVKGPRELARLGQALNTMMATIQERTEALEERNRQLLDARALASTDGLTGIFNHRAFQERIRQYINEAAAGTPVSLIMLDIDSFKEINDALGHQKGDEILRRCSDVCARIGGRENVYRYGGDELALLMPGKSLAESSAVADRLRNAMMEAGSEEATVSVSVGVASYPETAGSAEELIYQADSAMYAAKSSGKNQVCRWNSAVTPPELRGEEPAETRAAS